MEVKIGVQYAARELTVETDETVEALEKRVAEAVAGEALVTFTDTKGRRVMVPAAKIAYVEVGAADRGTVGFRS